MKACYRFGFTLTFDPDSLIEMEFGREEVWTVWGRVRNEANAGDRSLDSLCPLQVFLRGDGLK